LIKGSKPIKGCAVEGKFAGLKSLKKAKGQRRRGESARSHLYSVLLPNPKGREGQTKRKRKKPRETPEKSVGSQRRVRWAVGTYFAGSSVEKGVIFYNN